MTRSLQPTRAVVGWLARRWKLAVPAAALILVTGGLMTACAVQRSVIYPAQHRLALTTPSLPEGVEVWHLETDQGSVEAWLIPGDGVSEAEPGPAVVFAHGNGEFIDDWPGLMQPYREWGVSVLLVEYRGYSRSAGRPTEARLVDDFTRYYDQLAEHPTVDPERIVLHGRSLGGGVVGSLAGQREPAAMILQSTFTSLPDVSARFGWPRGWVRDRYDTIGFLKTYDGPVLILHGRSDKVIVFSHAERNHEAASNSTLVAYDAGHDEPAPGTTWDDIQAFLSDAGLLEGSSP